MKRRIIEVSAYILAVVMLFSLGAVPFEKAFADSSDSATTSAADTTKAVDSVLKLHVNNKTGNITITDTRTGVSYETIPTLKNPDMNSLMDTALRDNYLSDMMVNYYYDPVSTNKVGSANDAGGSVVGTASQYTPKEKEAYYSDSQVIKKDQLTVEKITNGYRLWYNFAQITPRLLPLVVPEGQLKQWLDKSKDPAMTENIKRYYTLVDMGELRKQINYWTEYTKKNPDDFDAQAKLDSYNVQFTAITGQYPTILNRYNALINDVFYVWYGGDSTSQIGRDKVEQWWRSVGLTQKDLKEYYDKFQFSNPYNEAGFSIPVDYTVKGDKFYATIKNDLIKAPTGVFIIDINILRLFGATLSTDDGYVFIPNGSGSIINNKLKSDSVTKATVALYGDDDAFSQKRAFPDWEQGIMPVFGIKKGNTAIMGIIESGDSHATINAEMDNTIGNSSINFAYTSFNTTLYSQIRIQGRTETNEQYQLLPRVIKNGYKYGILPKGDFTISYQFLYNDQANYTGMANKYRDYLISKGMTKIDTTKKNANIPMFMDVPGCIDKKQLILGMPFIMKYPLTTFDQAETIMDSFNKVGVGNFSLRYLGWVNGGMKSTIPTTMKIQSQLGGKKGLLDLIDYMSKKNYSLYPDVNLITVNQDAMFDGYDPNADTSKRVDFVYAILNGTNLANGEPESGVDARYVISPRKYDAFFAKFLGSANKFTQLKSYSLSEMGKSLSSDFSLNNVMYKNEGVKKIVDLVSKMKDEGYSLATDTGNSYMLPYVDAVFNFPLSSSKLLIETEQVPFAQIALHGYVQYAGEAFNFYQNDDMYILKCLEYGANPYAYLMYADDNAIKKTDMENYYSLHYENWLKSGEKIYKTVNDVMRNLQDKKIINHEKLAEGVYATTYEGGTKIIVNYNDSAYVYNGKTIAALGYLVQ